MVLIIMIIITFSLWLFSYYVLDRDIMTPSFLLLGGYLVSFLSTLYNYRDWGIEIGFKVFSIFFIGMISFFFGEILVQKIHINIRYSKFDDCIPYIRIERWKYILSVIVGIIILFLTYREVVRIASLNFVSWGNLAYNYKTNVANSDLEGASLSTLVQQANKITKGFAYVYLFVFINNMFSGVKTKRNLLNLILPVIFALQCLLKGGRFPVIALFIAAFFLYYFFWKKTRGWNRSIEIKTILKIAGIIVLIVAAFWFSREIVGRLTKDNDMLGYVTRYFGGPAALMELYLEDISTIHDEAREVFAGLLTSFNKLGITSVSVRSYHEFRGVNGSNIGNAYSAMRNYFHDYGYLGVAVMNFLLAIIFGNAYYRIRLLNKYNSQLIFNVMLYSSFAYTILFQFFTDYFFARLSVGLLIEILILWLCYFFIFRIRVRFKM